MKKFFYSVLAVAAIVACSKEKEAPVKNEGPVEGGAYELTLKAFVAEEEGLTKTAYANDGTFSWVAKDTIKVRIKNSVSGALSTCNMYAAESGSNVAFSVTLSADNYVPDSIAVYSPYKSAYSNTLYNGSSVRVSMPVAYCQDGANKANVTNYNKVSFSSDNPWSILPLVGVQQTDGTFKFQTAVGLIHVQMTDLEDAAAGVLLTSKGGAISNYLMVRDGAIAMDDAWYSGTSKYGSNQLYFYFNKKDDNSASIYIPIPVGTLKAGSTISVIDAAGNTLFTKEFQKDVVVGRNKLVELAPFRGSEDWTSLGTGKYIDALVWSLAGFAAGEYVDVETYYAAASNSYKIVNPYGAAATKFNYTPAGAVAAPGSALIVSVDDDGYAYYDEHNTGVYYNKNFTDGVSLVMPYYYSSNYPSSYASFGKGANYVAKKNASGVAENIVLSPVYCAVSSNYWFGDTYIWAKTIQIVLPGATALNFDAAVAFVEIADDTPAQPVANVAVAIGNAYKQASVVIAADETAAAAALQDASAVTVVTAGGNASVKLPANAASGKYKVYASFVPADGVSELLAEVAVSEEFQYDRSDENWTEIGKGKFVDNNYWTSFGGSRNTYVDVDIIRNPNDATNYRVLNPYGVAATQFGYSPAVATTPGEYLNLVVSSDGSVYYDPHDMGLYNSTYKESTIIYSPLDYITRTGFNNDHNFVVKYASDGTTPANIILAPVYYWPISGYWTGTNYINQNDGIQIVFPGSEPIDASVALAYSDLADDTPAQPIAEVLVDPGNAFASVQLVIAADAAGASAAFADNSRVTVATGTGSYQVNLPADAASGTYYVFGITVPADGVSAKVAGSVVSDPFQYNRADEDLGITVDDIFGSYTADVTVNWMDGNNYVDDTIDLVAEETDDDNAGDFRFTTFVENGSLYAWLDGRTGKITIDPGQVMATYSFWTDNDPDTGDKIYTDLDMVPHQFAISGTSLYYDMTNPIELRFDKDSKKIFVTSSTYLGIRLYYAGTSSAFGLYCILTGGGTDDYISFTKNETSSSAPKAAARKSQAQRKANPSNAKSFATASPVSSK